MSALRMGSRWNRRSGDHKFQTDTDISRSANKEERQLEAWVDSDTRATKQVENLTLEETNDGKGWNQFKANKEKFGIVSTYEDRFYTTEIDTSHPDFAEREQRAARIAKEIESQAFNGNLHLAEERGGKIDDSGIDEEDKYSGVSRGQSAGKGHRSSASFAFNEAKKAMASPTYLAEQEKAERLSDAQKLSKELGSKGDAAPSSKEKQASKKQQLTTEPQSQQQQQQQSKSQEPASAKADAERPKKKFNFSAAAAKSSSFRNSASPSPHMAFSALPARPPSGSVSPIHMNVPMGGRIPVMAPGGMPYAQMVSPPKIHMPVSYGSNKPSHGHSGSAAQASPASIDVKNLKSLGDHFDFLAQNKLDSTTSAKVYFTPPTWSTISQVSYVDQFPAPSIMSQRMPMFMPPVGYMMPPHPYQ